MVNILIVEDNITNSKLLKLLVESIAREKFEEYNIDVVENGYEAMGILSIKKFDLMFLDVKMPKLDGVSLLTALQSNEHIHVPYICMATSMGEEKYKLLYNLKGANAYLIKPIQKEKLHLIIERALEHKFKIEEIIEDEEFCDFDNDEDFFDFDDDFIDPEEEIITEQKEQISKANATHAHISAKTFLEEINLEIYQDTLDDIDELYEMLLNGKMTKDSIHEDKELIIELLGKYATFLNNFPDFYEISFSLHSLKDLLDNFDINKFYQSHQDYISTFVFLLLKDVYKWKQEVFVYQDTIDVFYINASALSNCIQLQNFLNKQIVR